MNAVSAARCLLRMAKAVGFERVARLFCDGSGLRVVELATESLPSLSASCVGGLHAAMALSLLVGRRHQSCAVNLCCRELYEAAVDTCGFCKVDAAVLKACFGLPTALKAVMATIS